MHSILSLSDKLRVIDYPLLFIFWNLYLFLHYQECPVFFPLFRKLSTIFPGQASVLSHLLHIFQLPIILLNSPFFELF